MQQEVNDFYTAAQDIQNEVVPTKEERELLDSLTEKEKTMDIDMEASEEAAREKEMEEDKTNFHKWAENKEGFLFGVEELKEETMEKEMKPFFQVFAEFTVLILPPVSHGDTHLNPRPIHSHS